LFEYGLIFPKLEDFGVDGRQVEVFEFAIHKLSDMQWTIVGSFFSGRKDRTNKNPGKFCTLAGVFVFLQRYYSLQVCGLRLIIMSLIMMMDAVFICCVLWLRPVLF
jgi:hypothetical protein